MLTSTVTQKGQVTIPKGLRDEFGIDAHDKVRFKEAQGHIKIFPTYNLLDIVPLGRAPKGKTALKGRTAMEKRYKRV